MTFTINLIGKTTGEILDSLKSYRNNKEIQKIEADILLRKLRSLYKEREEIEEMYCDYKALLHEENQLDDFSYLFDLNAQEALGAIRGEFFWENLTKDKILIEKIKDKINLIDSKIKISLIQNQDEIDKMIGRIASYGVLVFIDRVKQRMSLLHFFEDNRLTLKI